MVPPASRTSGAAASPKCSIASVTPFASTAPTIDERVVALDPAVRGEDEDVEPDRGRLAVVGDRLPSELDDVAEPLGVVAPPEAEPLGTDPVLVGRSRPRLELGVSPRLESCRQPDTGARGDLAHLLRRLEDLRPVLRPELGDHPPAPVCVGLVPERHVSIRELLCRARAGLGGWHCFAHVGCLL